MCICSTTPPQHIAAADVHAHNNVRPCHVMLTVRTCLSRVWACATQAHVSCWWTVPHVARYIGRRHVLLQYHPTPPVHPMPAAYVQTYALLNSGLTLHTHNVGAQPYVAYAFRPPVAVQGYMYVPQKHMSAAIEPRHIGGLCGKVQQQPACASAAPPNPAQSTHG
jgi:hypothetical protein